MKLIQFVYTICFLLGTIKVFPGLTNAAGCYFNCYGIRN